MVYENHALVVKYLKELIMAGTDNFEKWVTDNPTKTAEILKAYYESFLDEIIECG